MAQQPPVGSARAAGPPRVKRDTATDHGRPLPRFDHGRAVARPDRRARPRRAQPGRTDADRRRPRRGAPRCAGLLRPRREPAGCTAGQGHRRQGPHRGRPAGDHLGTRRAPARLRLPFREGRRPPRLGRGRRDPDADHPGGCHDDHFPRSCRHRGGPRPGGRPRLPRPLVRRPRRDLRRGRLQHRDDRLPGDSDRSLLPPAGRRHDGSPRRQHRRQRRGPRVPADLGLRLRGAGPRPPAVQLAVGAHPGRGARRPGRRRHLPHRHPCSDPAPARARCHACRHLLRRPPRRRGDATGPGQGRPADEGRRPERRGRHHRVLRRPRAGEEAFHRRRRGPGHQGNDAPPDGRARHRGARRCRPPRPSTTSMRCGPTGCSSPTGPATRPPRTTLSS